VIDAYVRVVDRVLLLVADADPATPLPACPAWTVHDVLAHLTGLAEDWVAGALEEYGSESWTSPQFARGAGTAID
jgi:hypothetical protein